MFRRIVQPTAQLLWSPAVAPIPQRTPIVFLSLPSVARAFTSTSTSTRLNIAPTTTLPRTTAPAPPPASTFASLDSDHLRLLPLLRTQPNHYITIHIQGFPFLVTAGDTVTLPFRIKGVSAGDVLRLTHASVLGSRDYTLKGNPFISDKLFICRAVVVGETSEPMRVKEKTKRRNRKVKKVKSKHPYTVIRIRELIVGGEEAVEP